MCSSKSVEYVPPFDRIGGALFTPSCSAADCELSWERDFTCFEPGIDILKGFRAGGFGTYPDNPFVRYAGLYESDWSTCLDGGGAD